MSTHNICFRGEIRKKIFIWIALLSGAMDIMQYDKLHTHMCMSSHLKDV